MLFGIHPSPQGHREAGAATSRLQRSQAPSAGSCAPCAGAAWGQALLLLPKVAASVLQGWLQEQLGLPHRQLCRLSVPRGNPVPGNSLRGQELHRRIRTSSPAE